MSEDTTTEAQNDDLRITGVSVHDIGQRLKDLGEQLILTGGHTDSDALRESILLVERTGDERAYEDADRDMATAIRRTLSGLSSFRRDYGEWERLTVEYALTRGGFTQREVASLLGVGLSTVNRWAQHPLTLSED